MALALHEAGIPKGVFNLINTEPVSTGTEMIENPLLKKISFTGSTRVGKNSDGWCFKNIDQIIT